MTSVSAESWFLCLCESRKCRSISDPRFPKRNRQQQEGITHTLPPRQTQFVWEAVNSVSLILCLFRKRGMCRRTPDQSGAAGKALLISSPQGCRLQSHCCRVFYVQRPHWLCANMSCAGKAQGIVLESASLLFVSGLWIFTKTHFLIQK